MNLKKLINPNHVNLKRNEDKNLNRINYYNLEKNEKIFPFSFNFLKKIKKKINSKLISNYPDLNDIKTQLAKFFKIDIKNIYLTPGGDGGCKSILEALIFKKKHNIIINNPSYAMFEIYCKSLGGKVIKIDYTKDFKFSENKYLSLIDRFTKVIIIENPSGYHGDFVEINKILKFSKILKKRGIFVVFDIAYLNFKKNILDDFDFSIINKYTNIIILVSFSKFFGLAGLRAGCVVANKNFIYYLRNNKPLNEINSFAASILNLALKEKRDYLKYNNEINKSKIFLYNYFKKKNILFKKTITNFVLVKFTKYNKKIANNLFLNKFLIRPPYTTGPLKGYIRLTVGNIKYLKLLIKKIDAIL